MESLRTDFGSDVIDVLCRRLVPGTLRHGERRAMEMDGALELASESGWEPVTLRWILTHMIEEYARHNGHADLIRESIDGRVGHDPPR